MLEEALKAQLLGFENSANKYKVYEVLVEALELIRVGGEEKERVLKSLLTDKAIIELAL